MPAAGASGRCGNYSQPGNLTALRELALRRTAQRVDEQMVDYMRAHAISGPWAAGERVLVGVNEDPGCLALVRYTRRLADRLRAPWTAVHVETVQGSAAWRRRAGPHRRGAAPGGEAGRRGRDDSGPDRRRGARRLCVGPTTSPISSSPSRAAPAWPRLLHGSVTHEIIRQAGEISVHVIAGRPWPDWNRKWVASAAPAETTAPTRAGAVRSQGLCRHPRHGGGGAGRRADPAAVSRRIGNIALVFLTAVLPAPSPMGSGRLWSASLVSALAYNFFFLPPLYTFTIADPRERRRAVLLRGRRR